MAGNPAWSPPSVRVPEAEGVWSIPGFYICSAEASSEAFASDRRSFFDALLAAERAGARLPSAAELRFAAQRAPLSAAIHGLDRSPWEWTTTRPGGALVQLPRATDQGYRILAGSRLPSLSESQHPFYPELRAHQWDSHEDFGFRAVRSRRPRRSPEDFVRPASSIGTTAMLPRRVDEDRQRSGATE